MCHSSTIVYGNKAFSKKLYPALKKIISSEFLSAQRVFLVRVKPKEEMKSIFYKFYKKDIAFRNNLGVEVTLFSSSLIVSVHIVCLTIYFSRSDWSALNFLVMTSPTCYTPVKYKASQKAAFPIVTYTTSVRAR